MRGVVVSVIKPGPECCHECGAGWVSWSVVYESRNGVRLFSSEVFVGCPEGHDIAGQIDVERRILVVPWDEELTLHGPF